MLKKYIKKDIILKWFMIIMSDNRNIDIYKHNLTTSGSLSDLPLFSFPDFPVSMPPPFCPKPYNNIKNNEYEKTQ